VGAGSRGSVVSLRGLMVVNVGMSGSEADGVSWMSREARMRES
jgi:hypothetical protein